MRFVEIYKLKNDGSQQIIATCKLIGELVECEGEETFIKNLRDKGILDYSKEPKEEIFPKNGIRFLENLKYYFNSGYLNASEIKEG